MTTTSLVSLGLLFISGSLARALTEPASGARDSQGLAIDAGGDESGRK
jgi:hypothetical protein